MAAASEINFSTFPLFGGAITAQIPAEFGDVSNFRQVPDHQEVFVQADGLTSIIFEILERVERDLSDEDALRFHFKDIVDVESSTDDSKIEFVSDTTAAHFPNTPVLSLGATMRPKPGTQKRGPETVFTQVILTLIRLKQQKTDFLVSVNVPHVKGEFDESSVDAETGGTTPLTEYALKIRDHIMSTVDVKDWTLFVQE